ncbi:uncharacterized protein RJT21DRAFT_142307 [Scheffersomyces amazonensis]|uniref:uncharacterized protein n=1 Tax=Scheffersomyces amazonensis TaxID=1078765 RepID=UPI00315CF4FF
MKSSILGAVFFAVFLLQTVLSENRTNIDVKGYYMLNITSMGANYDCDFYANMTVHEHSTFIFNSYNFHSYGGSTFINKGIFYSQNLGAYPWYDPTHNSGSSFKLNEGQTTGGIHNTGFFMYNDNTTNCGPPTYTIHGNFFINEGTFILAGCQACDGSTNIIKPYGTNAIFHNTGVLAYMQYFMTVGDAPSTYWGSDSACTTSGVATVINNGSLCLFNNNPVYQGSQYAGNGCIDIGNQSTFFLRCAQLFGLDGNLQTFYLSTNTSVLYFDNIGVSNAPATPYLVSGWGNNNQITIHISDPVWNYDGKTLSITAASVTYQFIIGPGYDPSLISWSQGPSGNNLRVGGARFVYNAPPPDSSRPSVCLPCPTVIPKLYDILQDQPDYTTTFTTTKSDGSVETDSGVIHVTNTDGTITTTTSLFPNEYTTTFTTTESDGFVATDSGIVFTTTDKDGNHITTTSLFPTSSDPFTRYTTTFITTATDGFVATDSGIVIVTYNTDGFVATDSGIVVVTYNTNGEVTTKTSLFPTASNPFTSYTTTFTTTETDGFVATDSGVVVVTYNTDVIVTYNSDEEVTTRTSLFPTQSDVFTSFTTTFTTTASDGFVATDSGIVIVTSASDGSWTTETSLFPTPSDPFTSYTTTFTTTASDGFVATDSGIVIVTYNSDEEVTTRTSLFPTQSDVFTSFTTTFTTTASDGFVATDSGIVIVTSASDGSWTTETSLFPTPSDPFTSYTTTFTTTASDGFVATDSEYVALDEDVVSLQELDGPTFEMTGGYITINGLYLEADETNGVYLGDTSFDGWSIVGDPILSLEGFGTEFYICPEEEVPLQLSSIDCNCFVGELHVLEDKPTTITDGATIAYVASVCNSEASSSSVATEFTSEIAPTATGSTITTTYTSNEVITITDCPETVTDCPLNSIKTTTIIHTITTTYCPESGDTTAEFTSEIAPTATGSTITTTYTSNEVITITDCPETVTDCPLNSIKTTTIIHTITTTYCPESGAPSREHTSSTTPTVNTNSVGEVSTISGYNLSGEFTSTVAAGNVESNIASNAQASIYSIIVSNANTESTVSNNPHTDSKSSVSNNAQTSTDITPLRYSSSIETTASSSRLTPVSPAPSVSIDESGAMINKWKVVTSLLALSVLLIFV